MHLPPISPADVTLGRPLTFTEPEEKRLHQLLRRAARELELKQPGWRVETVQAITEVNRILRGAVARGFRPQT